MARRLPLGSASSAQWAPRCSSTSTPRCPATRWPGRWWAPRCDRWRLRRPRLGAEKLLDNPVFDFIGNASYSWYSLHWPLLILFPEIIDREFGYADRWRVAVLSFLLAVCMHYLIERRFKANVRMVQIPWRGILMGLSLTATAAVAMTLAVRVVPLNLSIALSGNSAAAMGFSGTDSVKAAVAERATPEVSEKYLLGAPKDQTEHGCIDNIDVTKFVMRDDCIPATLTGRKRSSSSETPTPGNGTTPSRRSERTFTRRW